MSRRPSPEAETQPEYNQHVGFVIDNLIGLGIGAVANIDKALAIITREIDLYEKRFKMKFSADQVNYIKQAVLD